MYQKPNLCFRLKSHLSTFEPQLDELKTKYDGAMREKMVFKLEKDKLQNELNALKLGNSMPTQSKEIYLYNKT
jgi:regulator of replication initiation timing